MPLIVVPKTKMPQLYLNKLIKLIIRIWSWTQMSNKEGWYTSQ